MTVVWRELYFMVSVSCLLVKCVYYTYSFFVHTHLGQKQQGCVFMCSMAYGAYMKGGAAYCEGAFSAQ